MSDTVVSDTITAEYRKIFGIKVSVLTRIAAITELDNRIKAGTPTRVAFLNTNLANLIAAKSSLKEAISSFLVLNDGIGIDIASVLLYGTKFPNNHVGTDFIPAFLTSTKHNLRLALLGGTELIIVRVVEVINRTWPRHQVVFSHHGYFTDRDDEFIAQAIAAARSQVVLVAMGNPLQEEWISRHIPVACTMGLGVGALFNYLVGEVPRAPPVILRWRLEWVHRLWVEPSRLWRRYLIGNFVFLWRLLVQWSRCKVLGINARACED